jgi:hypothetical protein
MPSKDEALQFAIMLQAGLPASEAILYFIQPEDPQELALVLRKWLASAAVKEATKVLLGKSWTEMTLEEKIKTATDNHYAQLAYFLFSHNYSDLGTTDKAKADTARQALEAKLAGTAGKGDALSQFFSDINSGKIKLGKPVLPSVSH